MELVNKQKERSLEIASRYARLHNGSRDILDRIVRLAASSSGANVAAIILRTEDGHVVRCSIGLEDQDEQVLFAFVEQVIESVHATNTEVFVDDELNPVYSNYSGSPLITSDNHVIGAFCMGGLPVEDDIQVKQAFLEDIARLVMGELELLFEAHAKKDIETTLARQTMELQIAKVTLEQQADQLQEMVTELEKAKKEVEASSRSKETFFASMSHEIRTPMNGVMGMTTLLLDTPLSEEQKGYVEVIRNSGESLLVIINDILDFSKIEAGQLDLESHPFDVITSVEDAFDLLAVKAAEKKLSLGLDWDPAIPRKVVGDSTRLRQVLVNLISNAIKFTDSGQVFVRIRSESLENDQLRLKFAVEDSGIGLTQEQIGRLFKSFSQAEASTSRKYGGTGLGLAICKSICTLMGGEIWVESEPGIGSTFYFNVVMDSTEHPSETLDHTKLAERHILVMEQHEKVRQLLSDLLKQWGMNPVFANSAEALLETLDRREDIDVVLLDLAYEEIDMASLAAQSRDIQGNGEMPVLAMYPVDKKISEVREVFDGVLTKPIRRDTLHQILCRLFSNSDEQDTSPKEPELGDVSLAERLPLRILLVEDNVVNQKVALRLLEKLGYRADLASNGREAVEASEAINYDLILMDVQMPEMNGIDATKQILASVDPVNEPIIIAMTAANDPDAQMSCLQAGMKGFLSKPFQFDDLVTTIETLQISF